MERVAFLARLRQNLPSAAALGDTGAEGSPWRPSPPGGDRSELFAERLRASGGEVALVATRRDAQDAVERLLAERSWQSVACSRALAWAGIAGRWTDEPRDAAFGLCEADWAAAETGAVVVRSSAEVRRGHSLVPPAIGVFVQRSRIRATIGDVLRELPADARAMPSCVSFISGPSSTADLASIHVVGVHGPGEVFVWVIEEASGAEETESGARPPVLGVEGSY